MIRSDNATAQAHSLCMLGKERTVYYDTYKLCHVDVAVRCST